MHQQTPNLSLSFLSHGTLVFEAFYGANVRTQPPKPEAPPDTYWVQPGKVLAGQYPTAASPALLQAKLRSLLQVGVSFFLDLTEAGEKGLPAYTSLLRAEADRLGVSVQYRRMAIPDFAIPSREQMQQILDVIEAALATGEVVFVHCYAGIGRTGTVVGCYLVGPGLSGKEALAEIARRRQGSYLEGLLSPVTEQQRQMVRDWSEPIGDRQ